ncbi:hypothetical protein [Cryobacterium sp. Hh11]|nr:hypothetical protein [Cryobacterium sp. Hh11]
MSDQIAPFVIAPRVARKSNASPTPLELLRDRHDCEHLALILAIGN